MDLRVDFDGWQLFGQAAFGALDKTYLEDDDGGPFAIGLFGTSQDGRHHSFELRAAGDFGRGSWQVGANHLQIEGDYFAIFQFPAITGASGAGVFDGFGLGYDTRYRLRTRANAVFGQLELDLAEDWRLVGGLRWTGEEQDFAISVRCVDGPAVAPGTCADFGIEPGASVRDVETAPGLFQAQRMTLAPGFTANAAIRREFALGAGYRLRAGVDGNYSSSIYFNTINGPLVRAGAYALANACLGLEIPAAGRQLELTLQVTNLFDARPVDYSFDLSLFFGNMLRAYAPPRQTELGLRLAF